MHIFQFPWKDIQGNLFASVRQETCRSSFALALVWDALELRHSNIPSATSRICHKLEKACVDTSAGNRVLKPDNQLCHSRTFMKQNKNSEISFRMSEFVKQSTNINSGIDKGWLTSWRQLFKQFYQRGWIVVFPKYNKYHLYWKTFLI